MVSRFVERSARGVIDYKYRGLPYPFNEVGVAALSWRWRLNDG